MSADKVVRQSVAVADPDLPANVIKPNADGSINLGTAAAGIYSDAVAYAGATTSGRGIAVVMSVAGTVTVTFASGATLVANAPVGTTILPFAATNVVQTTGTMTAAYKLT